ncbi:MAG: efflux RND transporter permease subunit [Candidatus Moraniibacteriota bacterium]
MQNNIFKKLAGVFIRNKELGVLVILFIVAFGVLGFVVMPKQYNPEIVAPAFRINTEFPGATSEEVYELVTRPMEDKVREISDVDDIYSQSMPGYSSVLVAFDIGSDENAAKTDLVQRLRSNMDEKPLGAVDPYIEEVDTDDVPIITLALTSDKFSESSLRLFAFDLVDSLKHVKNTAKMSVHGGRTDDLSIFVDTDKLANYNIGINEVIGVIKTNNTHVLNINTDDSSHNTSIRVFGNIENKEKLEKLVINEIEGSTVRIEDVATVENGPIAIDNYVRFEKRDDSKDAVYVGIAKLGGVNATTVSKAVEKELEMLKQQNIIPSHVEIDVVRDDGNVANEEIFGLTRNLITSIVIIVIILLLFLNTRSALIVAIAIPLSLLAVFGLGMLFDQTINRITLFALILSLGLLVDNATVVVENMYRHLKMRKNENREEVITDAVAEVGSGLVMSTITTVLAFIPMAFVTGMMGPYMGPIPFFVPVAIVASLFVALTISPFIGNKLLTVEEDTKGLLNKLRAKIRKFVSSVENNYEKFIVTIFADKKKQKILLGIVGMALVISMLLPAFALVKFRMLPKADRNQFYVYIDTINNTSIEKTDDVAKQISHRMLENENIVTIQSTVGTPPVIDFNGLFKGSDARQMSNHATLKANLVHKDDRKITSEEIATSVRENLKGIGISENANIKIIEDPPGPPVLSTYQLKVQGFSRQDQEMMREIAGNLLNETKQLKGIVDIDTSRLEHSIEKTYRINTEESTRVGVSVDDVILAINATMRGVQIDLYNDSLDNEKRFSQPNFISLRAQEKDRDDVQDLSHINMRSKNGELVSLASLLQDEELPLDDVILMDGRRPTVYVGGEMSGRSVVYASMEMLKYLVTEYRLPSENAEIESWNLFGVNYIDEDGKRYSVKIGGEWELTLEVFRDMGIAFGVAIFLIYFVLVAQFKSLRVPLYVMATIPLALIGVLPGFFVLYVFNDTYFNATSMIGVIALAGIVVNNAIIYLEYVFQLKDKGENIENALTKAGKTRLLPIALTSLTTILGSLTIISDPVWEGLAWAIITGLSLSAFLTLVILPVVYKMFEEKTWNQKINEKL